MEEVKKLLGLSYNPIRWLLRRVLSSQETDEVLTFIGAIIGGKGID